MTKANSLIKAPPYAVETALKKLGADLRTARLRRNLTIEEVAEKIGVGRRVVADAERGKASTSIGTHAGLLWVFDLLNQLAEVADPDRDIEGQRRAQKHEPRYGRRKKGRDNDF